MAPSNASRRKQTRLAFTPVPSSSPAVKDYNRQIQARAAIVSIDSPRKKHHFDQPDGAADSFPTPIGSLDQTAGARDDDDDDEEDADPMRSTQRGTHPRISRERRGRQKQLDFTRIRDPQSFSPPLELASSPRTQSSRVGIFSTQARQKKVITEISSGESEDLPSPGTLTRSKKQKKREEEGGFCEQSGKALPIVIESQSDAANSAVNADDDEEDEDDMPTTLGTQRRKRATRASRDSFISSSPPAALDSDDDVIVVSMKRRRTQDQEDDEDDQDSPTTTPARRRLKRTRTMTQQEEAELADDLEFLGPSSDVEASARRLRDTQTPKQSARQQALDKLKRQRSGQPGPVGNEDEDEDEAAEHTDDRDDLYSVSDDDDIPQITSSRQMFAASADDEAFIDQDDESALGVPAGIPLEFTHYRTMRPKQLFKYAIEWMVQKKINPAFASNDEIYSLTWQKLDDEVRGLAASKFLSAVWTPEYTLALKARPELAYTHVEAREEFSKCEACNRSSHLATYEVMFQGTPYHPETLEEVAGHADDSSSDDDDDAASPASEMESTDRDYKGRPLVSADTVFHVGRFCMANTETAHALTHWRLHLNEWVVEWLKQNGYLTAEKLVQRDGRSVRKRAKEANRIADRMGQEGVVGELWRLFRGRVEEARGSKQDRFRDDSP